MKKYFTIISLTYLVSSCSGSPSSTPVLVESDPNKVKSFLSGRTLIAKQRHQKFSTVLDKIYFHNNGMAFVGNLRKTYSGFIKEIYRNKWVVDVYKRKDGSDYSMVCINSPEDAETSYSFSPKSHCSQIQIIDNSNAIFEHEYFNFGYPDRIISSWVPVRMESGDSQHLIQEHSKERANARKQGQMVDEAYRSIGSFLGGLGKHSSTSVNKKEWTVVKDNRKALTFKNVKIRCNNGSNETIPYEPKKSKPYGSFFRFDWYSTLGEAARKACNIH